MSEGTAYKKLRSLQAKGAIELLRTEHTGSLVRVLLPAEIPGVIPPDDADEPLDIEEMDFFAVPENRALILAREDRRCFYTLTQLDESNFVIDHVVSRPQGGNGYRNLVACSREANNRKGAMAAVDFIRRLFRDGYLS